MDYNTQREKLLMPEYGREVQCMVQYAMTLPQKSERQRCAEAIVKVMARMSPQESETQDGKHKLWDHLALLSNFQLDIDYPVDITRAVRTQLKPAPLEYPHTNNPVKHYGALINSLLEMLRDMPNGPEKDELTQLVATQMRHNLTQWGHGFIDDTRVANDIERMTSGRASSTGRNDNRHKQ